MGTFLGRVDDKTISAFTPYTEMLQCCRVVVCHVRFWQNPLGFGSLHIAEASEAVSIKSVSGSDQCLKAARCAYSSVKALADLRSLQ